MTLAEKIQDSSNKYWPMCFGPALFAADGLVAWRRRPPSQNAAALAQRPQDSEDRFRLLAPGVRDHSIFRLGAEGHVVGWNAAAEQVTGWTEAEILHRRFTVFFPDEAVARGDPDSQLSVAAAEGKYVERAQRQRKDGSIFWAEVEMTALYDAKGEVSGFAKALRDLSDPVQAGRDVAGSRASIVESAMDAIITVDAEQNIVEFNHAAEKIFGYARADIVGSKLDVLIPERFAGDHANHIVRSAAPGASSRTMGRSGARSARRADGARFPIEVSVSQASLDRKKFFTIILRDDTERKERQARLLREFGSKTG